ncbi:unnamed protein product [Gongylonema pulchrum]|uniref:Kinesin motor domain-containing protein n=1 Tax=Gongylonema pulchrum TaxID=637853 RepID=A0A183DLX6_9BILA|nr:unnamed protein product [Gongylonema pulchrum]
MVHCIGFSAVSSYWNTYCDISAQTTEADEDDPAVVMPYCMREESDASGRDKIVHLKADINRMSLDGARIDFETARFSFTNQEAAACSIRSEFISQTSRAHLLVLLTCSALECLFNGLTSIYTDISDQMREKLDRPFETYIPIRVRYSQFCSSHIFQC